MIQRTKQNWTIGSQVRVGFLTLLVKAAIPTPGDSRPDSYLLTSIAGDKVYSVTPHHGLERLELHEARELLEEAAARARRIADEAVAHAAGESRAKAAIDAIFEAAALGHQAELASAAAERRA